MDKPVDPDVEELAEGLEGIKVIVRMMGELFRGLIDEGFKRKEALVLCKEWMLQAAVELEEE